MLLDGDGVGSLQGRREQLPEACHILAEGDASHELLLSLSLSLLFR